jgi:VIT1/CCC1 family predicted Fe2+/Mn2+ transporter
MDKFRQQFKSAFSDYFKEVVYGGMDGIVTTFAVVAGFAGAAISSDQATQLSFFVVLLFGLANLFADGASMGLGNFLSVRSEKDLYHVTRDAERDRLRTDTATERDETMRILMDNKGFSPDDAAVLANTYKNNEEYWIDFMMHHKQGLPDPRSENEMLTGLATFVSFMIFGTIPLLPFIIQESGDPATTFYYSASGTFLALVILGLLKWRVIGGRFWASMSEVLMIGGTAAVLAYFVGTFFAG